MSEYTIQGDYGFGWENVAREVGWDDAWETLTTYRDNQPQYRFRIRPYEV